MVALTAAAMAAVVSAVAIAIADLWLVGHGHAGLHKEIAGAPGYLSAGDVMLLVFTLLAGAAGWILSGRKR